MSLEELERLRKELHSRREAVLADSGDMHPSYVRNHGPVEDMSASDTEVIERGNRSDRFKSGRTTVLHHGSVENMSASDIEVIERGNRSDQFKSGRTTVLHHGSVENLDEATTKVLEAHVAERRKTDKPYNKYLADLVQNPQIDDVEQFEDAASRSIQSNRVMEKFTSSLVQEISSVAHMFGEIDKNDTVKIQEQKSKLEKLVNVYVRFIYELKRNDWNFANDGYNTSLHMIDSETLDKIWQIQKQYGITFDMPIPRKMEGSGKAFERTGKMVPGIQYLHASAKGKKVNWEQIMNPTTQEKQDTSGIII